MVNRFVLNAVSYHGNGAIKEIPGIVSAKGFKKAFIASDPDLVKFGVTKKVTDLLDEAGMAYEVYSDIQPDHRKRQERRCGLQSVGCGLHDNDRRRLVDGYGQGYRYHYQQP